MNTDEEGDDTDGGNRFAKQSNHRVHPWISVFIIFKPYGLKSTLRSKGITL